MLKFLLAFSTCLLALPGARASAADLVGVLPAHSDLQITLENLPGVQPSTRNNMYLRVTVARAGKQFAMFCDRRGVIEGENFENIISCVEDVSTVSDDDNESLVFEIALVSGKDDVRLSVRNIMYQGDGTFLGEQVRTLTGLAPTDRSIERLEIELAQAKTGTLDGFNKGAAVNEILVTLLGNTINGEHIASFKFTLSPEMSLSVTTRLAPPSGGGTPARDPDTFEFSLLKVAGDLDSGMREADEVREELRRLLGIDVI